jgi:predicted nucleic acid-binding protein
LRLFLDSSVVLAACGSERGASRLIFNSAADYGWDLLTTPYAINEVNTNVPNLGASAERAWPPLLDQLTKVPDVVTSERPVVFLQSKDRPILLSALAWADVLLTLDRADFIELLGQQFYELQVLTPGGFLMQERAAGRVNLLRLS